MNFLVDNPLFPGVAEGLRAAGHDAVHVLDYRMQAASDEAIFERAALESRVVVSADTDFGTLLSLRESTSPSVILFRGESPKRAAEQVSLILAACPPSRRPSALGRSSSSSPIGCVCASFQSAGDPVLAEVPDSRSLLFSPPW